MVILVIGLYLSQWPTTVHFSFLQVPRDQISIESGAALIHKAKYIYSRY